MIDPTIDVQVNTIVTLCEAAIRGDLGADSLIGVFKDPRHLVVLTEMELPGLSVYVDSEKKQRMSSTRYVDNLMVFFDYMQPATMVEERDVQYPPLRHVWRSIVNVLQAGKHASINGGAEFLCSAAALEVVDGTEEVIKYGVVKDNAHPFFHARMMIEHTPADVDWNALDDFLKHFSGYTLPGGDEYDTGIPINDTTLLSGADLVESEISSSSALEGEITDS